MRRAIGAGLGASLLAGGWSQPIAAEPSPAAAPAEMVAVPQDTLVRLMVLNEVSSRSAKAGDRFVLRVDESVVIDGFTIVPVGATAWGRVEATERSGAVGKAGRLQVRLLHIEAGGAQIPIGGESKAAGRTGGTQVAMGMLGLGPLALLAPGNNAKLKAGDIFSAFIEQPMLYDPSTGRIVAAPGL